MSDDSPTGGSAPPAFRSFLVAVDGSARSPLVLATAAALARDTKATLVLVRVLTVPPEIPAAAHSRPDHLEQRLETEARSELHEMAREFPDVNFGAPVVLEGDPWRSILEVADRLDVDLIVMGSHGYHGLDRVLGTVAAKVVNHAHRDVLVVHRRDRATGPVHPGAGS